MNKLIESYINNLTVDKLGSLATKNNIYLSENELGFSYKFIKKNWSNILTNITSFNIEKIKNNYTEENFNKIKKLYLTSIRKYANYL